MFNGISVDELQKKLDAKEKINLIDVRESHEYQSGHIKNAKNIPLSVLSKDIKTLDKNSEYYLICASGARSMQASLLMKLQGFNTINVKGGMMAWKGKIVS